LEGRLAPLEEIDEAQVMVSMEVGDVDPVQMNQDILHFISTKETNQLTISALATVQKNRGRIPGKRTQII